MVQENKDAQSGGCRLCLRLFPFSPHHAPATDVHAHFRARSLVSISMRAPVTPTPVPHIPAYDHDGTHVNAPKVRALIHIAGRRS